MTRPKLLLIFAIVLVSGVVSWTLQNSAATKTQGESLAFQRQASELNRLRDENARLLDSISQASASNSLSDEAFRELLRSRNEVGQLRHKSGEVSQLHAKNQVLLTALAKTNADPGSQPQWTRDQLADIGFADPESAIITTFWAMNNDDPNAYLSTLTAEQKIALAHQGKSEADIVAQGKGIGRILNPESATRISMVGKKFTSPDDAIIDLYYEGEGKTRKFAMQRVDGQWRLRSLISITAN